MSFRWIGIDDGGDGWGVVQDDLSSVTQVLRGQDRTRCMLMGQVCRYSVGPRDGQSLCADRLDRVDQIFLCIDCFLMNNQVEY